MTEVVSTPSTKISQRLFFQKYSVFNELWNTFYNMKRNHADFQGKKNRDTFLK